MLLKISIFFICQRAWKIRLIISERSPICVPSGSGGSRLPSKIPCPHQLIRHKCKLINRYHIFNLPELEYHIVYPYLSPEYLFFFLDSFEGESENPPHILAHIEDGIMLRAEEDHHMLDIDERLGAEISKGLDWVEVHDECIRKLWTVIEVEKYLNRLNVSREVPDIHIADSPNKASQSILQEPLDKEIVMTSNLFRHHYSCSLAYNILLGYVKCLAGSFVAIKEFSNLSFQKSTIFQWKNSKSNIINISISDPKPAIFLLHVFDHQKVSEVINHLVVWLSIVK